MEMEIELLIQFLYSDHLDSIVMEMEIVFQVHLLFRLFALQDKQVMEMEIAFQIQ